MDEKAFAEIFEAYKEAVTAVKDGKIAFFNTAAAKLFPDMAAGETATKFFPAELLNCAQTRAAGSVVTDAGTVPAYAVHTADAVIVTVFPAEQADAGESRLLEAIGGTLKEAVSVFQMSSDVLRKPDMSEKEQQYAAMLDHTYYQLARVAGHLTEMYASDGGPLRVTCFDLAELCRDTVDAVGYLTHGRFAEIACEGTEKTLLYRGDESRIERLIMSLLSNSLKHTPADGLIRLKLEPTSNGALISVTDNGSGIDRNTLRSVFSPLKDEKRLDDVKSGLGLGLPMVQHIAGLHRGSAVTESAEGCGTTVTVRIEDLGEADVMRAPEEEYRARGLSKLLTELADVLDYTSYTPRNMD